jgi:hypothetical protein
VPFAIPPFKNGQTLQDRDLFGLAALSFERLRWGAVAAGAEGFFAPPADRRGAAWNPVDVRGGKLYVHPLFLLRDGYPLLFTPPNPLELASDGDRLYAKLRVARAPDEYAESGYAVEFAWDDCNPDGQYLCVAELARRVARPDGTAFDLVPPAATPGGTPDFAEAHERLRVASAEFRGLLAEHGRKSGLGRDVLLDRLGRLEELPATTPTPQFLAAFRLAARATLGFFRRLREAERAAPAAAPGPAGLAAELLLSRTPPPDDGTPLPPALTELAAADPPTAAQQARAAHDFAELLGEGRELWAALSDNRIPLLEEGPGADGYVVRSFDCLNLDGVRVEARPGHRGNSTFAFGPTTSVPGNLTRTPTPVASSADRTAWRLPVTDRYLFVSVRKGISLSVSPEEGP